jgi:hypothetical protein
MRGFEIGLWGLAGKGEICGCQPLKVDNRRDLTVVNFIKLTT